MRPAAPQQFHAAVEHAAAIENNGFLPELIELFLHCADPFLFFCARSARTFKESIPKEAFF